MKSLIAGHKYELSNFENPEKDGQVIQFIQKIPSQENPTQLTTVSDGTTNEEVLAVLIDRLNHLYNKFPSRETAVAITHIETALMWLEKRTKDRIKRGVEGQHKA